MQIMHECNAPLPLSCREPRARLSVFLKNVFPNNEGSPFFMSCLSKSAALSLGLLAGIAAAAQAQSVSSLPPPSGVTPASPPPVTSSTPLVGPKPGGAAVWQEEHYQPAPSYAADKTQHPY